MNTATKKQSADKPPTTAIATRQSVSLIGRLAHRFSIDADKALGTLKATAFRVKDKEVTNEQMMALLIVAEQYQLNPWTKEIYAFPDKTGGIVPAVSIDGWIHIINAHPQFESMELKIADHDRGEIPEWFECTIHRKDRTKPTVVREYFDECKRNTDPWNQMPRRMLRHKAIIQCGRVAFGFAGIYDPDEAERIVSGEIDVTPRNNQKPQTALPKATSETPALANEGQLEHLRELMAKCDVADEALCQHFNIAAIEELQFDQVAPALEWISAQ